MAEINLLKQTSPTQNFSKHIPSLLVKLFIVIGVVVLGFYVWMNIQTKVMDKKISELAEDIVNQKKSALSLAQRDELITKQSQLKEYVGLASTQTYFSGIFEPLAQQTYKNSKYLTMKATADGSVTLKATAPSLQDLHKIFQMFNTEGFMKNFSNVKVGAFFKSKTSDNNDEYLFDIRMNYNTEIIKNKSK